MKLNSGGMVPVISLSNNRDYAGVSQKAGKGLPLLCYGIKRDGKLDAVLEILDRAGDERFYNRAAGFREKMAGTGAGQTIYRGIMGALGYSRNKARFLELADKLPLERLEGMVSRNISDEECLVRL